MPTNNDAVFIHGLRADDEHWTDVSNFSLAGTRSSIGVVNAVEGQVLPENVDVDLLKRLPSEWPPMFLSGFLSTVWQGAIVRNGLALGRGVSPYPTRWATDEHASRILRNADRELALEVGRREHAPSSPSRLSCLWMAENTTNGRNWVQRILGPRSFVMRVQIALRVRLAACDARWLDQVYEDPHDDDAIAGYWSGCTATHDPLWEYLLEGQIANQDPTELERLREFIRVNGPSRDMITWPPE